MISPVTISGMLLLCILFYAFYSMHSILCILFYAASYLCESEASVYNNELSAFITPWSIVLELTDSQGLACH
jgi:hypothetical protein